MMHKVGDKIYVDTAFLNAIQAKMPSGSTMHHMGYGEFYLQTPVGKVQFDRMRGKDFEGQDGRSHLIYGDTPAVELMLAHAEGC